MLKLNFSKIAYSLLIIYPLLNLTFCWWNQGDNMNVFSFSFCIIILICLLAQKRTNKVHAIRVFIILFILSLVSLADIMIAFIREAAVTEAISSILFSICMLMLFVYSEPIMEIGKFQQIIRKKKNWIHTVNVCFILLLLLYVYLYGLRAGWGTWVLQGPYNYPHTLSYLLLFMILQELYLFIDCRNKISAVLIVVLAVMLLATAVRTAVVALLLVVLFMMSNYLSRKQLARFFLISIALILLFFLFYEQDAFESLVQKTALAVSNGSVSNGRIEIAVSSLGILKGNGVAGIVIGVGLSKLQEHNLYKMGAAIHAHNDLIDILVSYGIISLLAYLYAFYKFIAGSKFWSGVLLGILLMFNGLFPYVDCLPMIIYSRLSFEGLQKVNEAYE